MLVATTIAFLFQNTNIRSPQSWTSHTWSLISLFNPYPSWLFIDLNICSFSILTLMYPLGSLFPQSDHKRLLSGLQDQRQWRALIRTFILEPPCLSAYVVIISQILSKCSGLTRVLVCYESWECLNLAYPWHSSYSYLPVCCTSHYSVRRSPEVNRNFAWGCFSYGRNQVTLGS